MLYSLLIAEPFFVQSITGVPAARGSRYHLWECARRQRSWAARMRHCLALLTSAFGRVF